MGASRPSLIIWLMMIDSSLSLINFNLEQGGVGGGVGGYSSLRSSYRILGSTNDLDPAGRVYGYLS